MYKVTCCRLFRFMLSPRRVSVIVFRISVSGFVALLPRGGADP